jgi:phosphoribosylamine--glycine ligase
MWCAPGNAGTAQERLRNGVLVENVAIGAEDLQGLLTFATEHKPDLTVVGPDNPLSAGIVDLFQSHSLRIWGPNRLAAQFESSKVFAQDFMARHGIPTARSGTFTDPTAAIHFAAQLEGRCAVKADGLALGKGVLLCSGVAEAESAIREILVSRTFGSAGDRIVIQEFLNGMEVSLHALCDGTTAKLFPSSQDHKRALDGDNGLNTGGMGTCSPVPYLSNSQLADAKRQIIDPWLAGCAKEGIDFRGILYPGLMLTKQGPKVLEFNARFGDPETQVYLTRLESDLVELLNASVDGKLGSLSPEWADSASVCVVMASAGYPGKYSKGKVISGIGAADQQLNTKVFHAGTALSGENVLTSGGRVLGVTSWGKTLTEAKERAYDAVERIQFEGAYYRRDIAAKALSFTSSLG